MSRTKEGIFDRRNFVGNTVDLNKTFKSFTGKNPEIKPMLLDKGLLDL